MSKCWRMHVFSMWCRFRDGWREWGNRHPPPPSPADGTHPKPLTAEPPCKTYTKRLMVWIGSFLQVVS